MASGGWSELADDALVEMWRERPCLFDTNSKAYSNRETRRVALGEMSFRLEKTADDILKRMKAMRTQFSRLSRSAPSGSGRRGITTHQAWILQNLEFLRPYVRARETKSTFQVTQSPGMEAENADGIQSDEEEEEEEEEEEDNSECESSFNTSIGSEKTPAPIEEQPAKKKRPNPGPENRRKKQAQQVKLNILSNIAENIAKPLVFPEQKRDEDDITGEYLASRLRKIKNVRIKAKLIATLNQAITDAELACMDDAEPLSHQLQAPVPQQQEAPIYMNLLTSDMRNYTPYQSTSFHSTW